MWDAFGGCMINEELWRSIKPGDIVRLVSEPPEEPTMFVSGMAEYLGQDWEVLRVEECDGVARSIVLTGDKMLGYSWDRKCVEGIASVGCEPPSDEEIAALLAGMWT